MKLIELHVLQSFPVTCLNRDDLGSPKSAVFGGAPRARISSQCLKRAIRMRAREIAPELFQGERSRLIVTPLKNELMNRGIEESVALTEAKQLCNQLATFDTKAEANGTLRVKTLMFLSPAEIVRAGEALAAELVADEAEKPKKGSGKETPETKAKAKAKRIAKKLTDVRLKDAADIALFGRMVASDDSLTVEGSALFSHALSTHRVESDVDFFTAVDDRQQDDPTVMDEDRAGSGMMGTLEYNSATYYRYVGLNLDMLWDKKHLEWAEAKQDREKIVDAFLRASLMAVPIARQNSMNGSTLPGFALGLVREGHPLQLINAFEQPVTRREGLMAPSIKALQAHWSELEKAWGLAYHEKVELPETPLPDFCRQLLSHV